MNIDFENIKSYLENKEENIYLKMFYYSIIIGVLLILVVIYSSYKKKDVYYENVLYLKNNEVYLLVGYNELEHLTNSKSIIVNDKLYNYSIKDIDLNENSLSYEVKIISGFLDIKYENVFYKYKVLLREESILKYIARIVKGE